MQVYRFVWTVMATVVLGTAVVLAVSAGAAAELVVLGAGLTLFAGMFVWVVTEGDPAQWQWVRRSLVWTAVGAPGLDALGTAWGPAGVGVAMILLLTAPALLVPARALYDAWASCRRTGPPEALSQRDLQRRWDTTTREVRHCGTAVSRRLVLLEERRHLLDELQRRDPVQFDSWVVTAVPDDRPPLPRRRSR